MSQEQKDLGTITVLLDRLNSHRLPRALALKEKVDKGEVMNELDIAFLEEVFTDANNVGPLVDKYPELNDLVAKLISLYKEITDKGLENQQKVSS